MSERIVKHGFIFTFAFCAFVVGFLICQLISELNDLATWPCIGACLH